jgi:hypothetical protein
LGASLTGEELWESRALDAAYDVRRELKRAISTADHKVSKVHDLAEELLADRDCLIGALEDLDRQLDLIETSQGDPAVLVRRTVGGYGPTPYHDAEAPCGHVWNREVFDEMLLGEAESAGYAPCGFCGFQAGRRRRYKQAA